MVLSNLIPDEPKSSCTSKPSKCGDWKRNWKSIEPFIEKWRSRPSHSLGWKPENSLILSNKTWLFGLIWMDLQHPLRHRERATMAINHSVCWAMQAAVFSQKLVWKMTEVPAYWPRDVTRPNSPDQMACWCSFLGIGPAQSLWLSTFYRSIQWPRSVKLLSAPPEENLFDQIWNGDIVGDFILSSYVKEKSTWTFPKRLSCIGEWPVRHPFCFLGDWHWKRMNTWNLWALWWRFESNRWVSPRYPV